MNSLPGVAKLLTESQALKARLLASVPSIAQLDLGAKKFSEISSVSGSVYIWTDERCRFSGLHLAEELQVRFTSGAPFQRPDRRAIPVENLSSYSLESAQRIAEKNMTDKDALILFTAAPTPGISAFQQVARRKNAFQLESFSLTGTVRSEAVLFSLHRLFLHILCEGAEPEYPKTDRAGTVLREAFELDATLLSHQKFLTQVDSVSRNLHQRISQGGAIYLCGNGGSACDALEITRYFQEFQAESGFPLRAHHFLDGAYLTCAVNDGFPLFARGVEGIRGEHNTLILITTSGKSGNLIEAAKAARKGKITTVGFLPESGGPILEHIDEPIMVPSSVGFRIQEIHALLGEMMIHPLEA